MEDIPSVFEVQAWSFLQVAEYIHSRLTESFIGSIEGLIKKVSENFIDGCAFLEATREDWGELGMLKGQQIRLCSLANEIKDNNLQKQDVTFVRHEVTEKMKVATPASLASVNVDASSSLVLTQTNPSTPLMIAPSFCARSVALDVYCNRADKKKGKLNGKLALKRSDCTQQWTSRLCQMAEIRRLVEIEFPNYDIAIFADVDREKHEKVCNEVNERKRMNVVNTFLSGNKGQVYFKDATYQWPIDSLKEVIALHLKGKRARLQKALKNNSFLPEYVFGESEVILYFLSKPCELSTLQFLDRLMRASKRKPLFFMQQEVQSLEGHVMDRQGRDEKNYSILKVRVTSVKTLKKEITFPFEQGHDLALRSVASVQVNEEIYWPESLCISSSSKKRKIEIENEAIVNDNDIDDAKRRLEKSDKGVLNGRNEKRRLRSAEKISSYLKVKDLKVDDVCSLLSNGVEVAQGIIKSCDPSQKIHFIELGEDNIAVHIEIAIKEEALLPFPPEEDTTTVGSAKNSIVRWPKHEVVNLKKFSNKMEEEVLKEQSLKETKISDLVDGTDVSMLRKIFMVIVGVSLVTQVTIPTIRKYLEKYNSTGEAPIYKGFEALNGISLMRFVLKKALIHNKVIIDINAWKSGNISREDIQVL